jgi:hypothetical protein
LRIENILIGQLIYHAVEMFGGSGRVVGENRKLCWFLPLHRTYAYQEVIADTADDPSVHLKLHWAGGSHTELTVRKNKIGDHNHINSEEVTELIRELALVCADSSIVSILNRLGYRTGIGNTGTEKRVQHVRHGKGVPACPPLDQRLWMTMQQAADALRVSEMVVRRLIAQKILPAKQIVKFAPWMIERSDLELSAVRKEIRRVHGGRSFASVIHNDEQRHLFRDGGEILHSQRTSSAGQDVNGADSIEREGS